MEENKNCFWEILKYIDIFGAEINFYIERNRKFYTPLGGILTFLSVILSVFVFISINYKDFVHENPITSSFILRENYNNIKFGEEKIWIPWRIRDYYNKKVDHKNLFYPIIFYYKGIKNENTKSMDLTYSLIDYKLCNETSMVNRSDIYMMNISLDELYCINMEDLNIGGNWQGEFINYVEFDLFVCKDGINYNESDKKCTTYEQILNSSINNSYEMEFYYPLVYYQPTNKSYPILVKYKNYFYHFSRYSNKIDRLYLQKYIFYDDVGIFTKNENIYSYWGLSSLAGDSYATSDQKDLMNEGSSSRLYSFNIYLNSDIICYTRSYKKILIILANTLPILNVIFVVLGIIDEIFKIATKNKKMTELLFVNIKEKFKRFNGESFTDKFNQIYKNNNNNINKSYQSYKKNISKSNIPYINKVLNNNINTNNNNDNNNSNNNINIIKKNSYISDNEFSSSLFHLNHQQSLNKNDLLKNENEKISIISKNNIKQPRNSHNILENYSNNIISNESFNKTINNININIGNNPDYENQKKNKLNNFQSNKSNNKKLKKVEKPNKKEKYYVKQKLFPYKYYFYSIFIKNINMTNNKSYFFTKKFLNVYNFICQILDISSYLILQKEFQTIKNTLMKRKYRDLIENRQKINVNDRSFNVDMRECLDDQKLSILGKIKNKNNNNNINDNSNSNSKYNNMN